VADQRAEGAAVVPPPEHSPVVAHHWSTLEQQHDANVLGMWVFLVTEVMLFGGMFLGYTVYKSIYSAAFAQASQHQNLLAGSINTCVLIVSSLMIALAVRSARLGDRRALVFFLILAAALGTLFLGIKGFEYYQHWDEGLAPGVRYTYAGPDANQAALFFFLYFVMTGLHAIHLSIGVVLVLIVAFRAWRGHFLRERYTGVEQLALYWHFVDIIWLFLFPLFYLLRGA
jgi:cytochrome c oxidase subunit III